MSPRAWFLAELGLLLAIAAIALLLHGCVIVNDVPQRPPPPQQGDKVE